MLVKDDQSLRVRVEPELKEKIDAMLKGRGVTTQRALEKLLEWVVGEDPLTQAMIFEQVPTTDRAELSRIVLRRLADAKGDKGKGRGK